MIQADKKQVSEVVIPSFALDNELQHPIPEPVELAAVFRLAERNRARRFVGFVKAESIDFLVKTYFPILVQPLDGRPLFIDPIHASATAVETVDVPHVDEFVQQLQAAHHRRDMFKNVLSMNAGLFVVRKPRTTKIEGLIGGPTATGISEYLKRAARHELEPEHAPLIKEPQVMERANAVLIRAEQHIASLREKLDALNTALSVLDRERDHHIGQLLKELSGIENEYSQQIDATKILVDQAAEELRKRKGFEVNVVSSRYAEAKETLAAHMSDYRRILVSLANEKDMLRKIVEAAPKHGTMGTKWKKLLASVPRRIKEIEEEVANIQALMDYIDQEKMKHLDAIETAYRELSDAKLKPLTDLKIEYDAEVRQRRDETKALSELASGIRQQLLQLIELTKSKLEHPSFSPPVEIKFDRPALILLPIYLACYRGYGRGRRYAAFPPSIFNQTFTTITLGFGLREERLKPYSDHLWDLLSVRLIRKLGEEVLLENEVYASQKPFDLLKSPDSRRMILQGLDAFYNKGWLHFSSVMALKSSLKAYDVKPAQP